MWNETCSRCYWFVEAWQILNWTQVDPKYSRASLQHGPIWYDIAYITSVTATEYPTHYCDVIIGALASQITSLMIVYSTVYSDADQRKHQSFASLAFVRGIHRGPVNSPHKWPVTRKMFPFDDVIMGVFNPQRHPISRPSSLLWGFWRKLTTL